MDFLEKLNYLMQLKHINKNILSKESGIPYTTIDGFYKKGYQNAKLPTIQKLANYFDTTLDYLIRDEITDINYGKANDFKVNYNEMQHIENYRALNHYGKKAVDSIMNVEIERRQKEDHLKKEESTEDITPPTRFIEFYTLPVSAGSGVYLDNGDKEMIEIPDNKQTAQANFVLRVSGNSMEPNYNDGDIILIKSQPSVNTGELGIFILNGQGYFKKCGEQGLISLNRKYLPIHISEFDSFICKGKVIGKL